MTYANKEDGLDNGGPDGGRLGLDRLEQAIDDTFERTAGLLQQPAAVQALLLGED